MIISFIWTEPGKLLTETTNFAQMLERYYVVTISLTTVTIPCIHEASLLCEPGSVSAGGPAE